MWDPFGEQSDCWDPLQGCEDWEHALLVAKWLGAARLLRDSSNQQYFDEEAQELAAPLAARRGAVGRAHDPGRVPVGAPARARHAERDPRQRRG